MQGRSLLKWLRKLLRRRATINKEERNNSPVSHPLAENSCATEVIPAKPSAILKGPEADLPNVPPPSYEDVSSSPKGADTGPIEAPAAIQRPQDVEIPQIVNETMARVDFRLAVVKLMDKNIDINHISSSIRQLCEFGACRTAEGGQRHLTAYSEDLRQETLLEVERLFRLVFVRVDWKQQGGAMVVSIVTSNFRETCRRVLDGYNHPKYWQASASVWSMNTIVYRTAGLVFDLLVEDKVLAHAYAVAAESTAKAAKSSNAAAQGPRYDSLRPHMPAASAPANAPTGAPVSNPGAPAPTPAPDVNAAATTTTNADLWAHIQRGTEAGAAAGAREFVLEALGGARQRVISGEGPGPGADNN